MLTLDKEKTLFLLGGYDLEMCTIRNLLDLSQFHYVDNHLHWDNAKLSSYRNEIERFLVDDVSMSIYGIELENDMLCTDSRYHLIDHHNAMSEFPSALEQVMTLLQFPMNRYCQLVAANDKRYIPGMLAIGATNEEIDMIRRSDRMAQGITEEDERLAEKAISENSVKVGDLLVIKAFTSRFSPICDRVFPYQSLLVYTTDEWTYYGKGVEKVRELFQTEYLKGKLFYGGGSNGYIGAKKAIYTENEINEFIAIIEHEYI